MLVDLKSFVACVNDAKRYPHHGLYVISGDLPVRQHEEHAGVLYAGQNLGNMLGEVGPPSKSKPGYPEALLKATHVVVRKTAQGEDIEVEEDGTCFALSAAPDGHSRLIYGLADSLDEVLAHFDPEIRDPARFFVIGISTLKVAGLRDGPHLTRAVQPGQRGPFIQFQLYELDERLYSGVKHPLGNPQSTLGAV